MKASLTQEVTCVIPGFGGSFKGNWSQLLIKKVTWGTESLFRTGVHSDRLTGTVS